MRKSSGFKIMFAVVCAVLLVLSSSCKEETLPKPKGFLALEYGAVSFEDYEYDGCPYTFEKNKEGNFRANQNCNATIEYPELNGALYLTYRKIDGNVEKLLADAQKLTYEHVVKADNIIEEKYVNEEDRVFGMFYDVTGNAASQSQFYVTDSTNHFLTGSIYFNAQPNYDSILPAAAYLKNDIRHLMETLKWK